MKAKEKAKELVNNYYNLIMDGEESDNWDDRVNAIELAKQCALSCVEEILKTLDNYPDDSLIVNHWQQVKSEIENL